MADDSEASLDLAQQRLLAALANGRHPRSLPRQSKLWHLINESSERLEKVSRGHSIVAHVPLSEDERLTGEAGSLTTSFAAELENASPKTGAAAVLDQLNVEFKPNLPLHFGMTVVITTAAHEVLVLTEDDQLVVKSVHEIVPSDQFSFQVVNLTNAVDSRPVKFNDPMWIQLPVSRKKRWENAAILAAKLECPPAMGHLSHGDANMLSNSDSSNVLSRINVSNPAICGSPVPLPIGVQRSADEAERDERVNRQKQRHACEVGQWTVRCATDSHIKATKGVLAEDVVYLEQNLYCIATAQGAVPISDFASFDSPGALARKHVRSREQLLQQSSNGEAVGTPACLRSIVFKDGEQYEYRLDRRCLWHVRVIESQETLKSLPKGEVKAHKLLRLAKRKLRQSEQHRAGSVIYPGESVDGRPLTSGTNFSRGVRHAMVSSAARLEQQSVRAQTASNRIRQLSRDRCTSANARLEGRRPSSAGIPARRNNVRLTLDILDFGDDTPIQHSCRVCHLMHHREAKYNLCSIHRKAESVALKACDRTQIVDFPVTPPIHQQSRNGTKSSLSLSASWSSDSLPCGGVADTGGARRKKLGVAVPVYSANDILCKFHREDENLIKIMRYETRATRANRVLSLFDEFVPKPSVDDM